MFVYGQLGSGHVLAVFVSGRIRAVFVSGSIQAVFMSGREFVSGCVRTGVCLDSLATDASRRCLSLNVSGRYLCPDGSFSGYV